MSASEGNDDTRCPGAGSSEPCEPFLAPGKGARRAREPFPAPGRASRGRRSPFPGLGRSTRTRSVAVPGAREARASEPEAVPGTREEEIAGSGCRPRDSETRSRPHCLVFPGLGNADRADSGGFPSPGNGNRRLSLDLLETRKRSREFLKSIPRDPETPSGGLRRRNRLPEALSLPTGRSNNSNPISAEKVGFLTVRCPHARGRRRRAGGELG